MMIRSNRWSLPCCACARRTAQAQWSRCSAEKQYYAVLTLNERFPGDTSKLRRTWARFVLFENSAKKAETIVFYRDKIIQALNDKRAALTELDAEQQMRLE